MTSKPAAPSASSARPLAGRTVLVTGGAENITARRGGMVHTDDSNSFYYGWVHKRNPRTIVGVDAEGRTTGIDAASTLEILRLLNAEDATVAPAVARRGMAAAQAGNAAGAPQRRKQRFLTVLVFQGILALLLAGASLLVLDTPATMRLYLWAIVIPVGFALSFARAYARGERQRAAGAWTPSPRRRSTRKRSVSRDCRGRATRICSRILPAPGMSR